MDIHNWELFYFLSVIGNESLNVLFLFCIDMRIARLIFIFLYFSV